MRSAQRPAPVAIAGPRGWVGGGALLALALSGCAAGIDVRTLATGRIDVSAYELQGPELGQLRREAARLCPQGGDILRQAGNDKLPSDPTGRLSAWATAANDALDPPKRTAQLVVVCKQRLDATVLPATVEAAASAVVADAPAPVAVGPITAEW